ncbi:hypothetical protein RI367_003544 [Sorochytrium milnesiophthora]
MTRFAYFIGPRADTVMAVGISIVAYASHERDISRPPNDRLWPLVKNALGTKLGRTQPSTATTSFSSSS